MHTRIILHGLSSFRGLDSDFDTSFLQKETFQGLLLSALWDLFKSTENFDLDLFKGCFELRSSPYFTTSTPSLHDLFKQDPRRCCLKLSYMATSYVKALGNQGIWFLSLSVKPKSFSGNQDSAHPLGYRGYVVYPLVAFITIMCRETHVVCLRVEEPLMC